MSRWRPDEKIMIERSLKGSYFEKKFTNLIKHEMTSVKDSDLHSFSTPLTVDVNSGDNWGLLN